MSILSGFDKEKISQLLIKAQGLRALNEFARNSGVSNSYISNLANMSEKILVPPSPEILRKLTNASKGTVTYLDFMIAAGHITYEDLHENIKG